MKNHMYLLLVLLLSLSARAQSPWYFGSGEAVNLTNGIKYSNGVRNIAGSLDPSAVAVDAPAGSMYLSTSGAIYVKQDAGSSTNWLPIGVASLTSINGQTGPAITLASGSAGTDFAISAAANTITFDVPSSSASNRGLLTSSDWSTFNGKEPAITAGTTGQYWRGDKSWQTLDKSAVGLGNVDNTSDANKPVSTATQTALDLKVDGVASSVDSEIMLFSGAGGKASKRATSTGFLKGASGVLSAVSAITLTTDVTGTLPVANGGTGAATLTANNVLLGNGTSAVQVVAPGTSGNVLKSNGTTWASSDLTDGTIIPTTPGITELKICFYQFGGASEPSTCSGSPCTEYYDSCGAFSAPTRGATGQYATTVTNGTFANNSRIMCRCVAGSGGTRDCSMSTSTNVITANASGGASLAVLVYNASGTFADEYAVVKCEGVSP